MSTVQQVIVKENITRIIKENLEYLFRADETLSTWLTNRIYNAFRPYFNNELLYNIEVATDMFNAKLYENLPELITRLRVDKQKFNSIFLNEDGTSGAVIQEGSAQYGYKGFSTSNQEGDFERTNTTTKTKGNHTLQYMVYLEQEFKKWATSFKDDVLNSISQLWYN